MAEGVWVVLVRHTSGLRTVGVEADVVLMITYINREAEGRIREILKDKKKRTRTNSGPKPKSADGANINEQGLALWKNMQIYDLKTILIIYSMGKLLGQVQGLIKSNEGQWLDDLVSFT